MNVGIVQTLIGTVGGNDSVLKTMIDSIGPENVTLFTFSKNNNNYGVKTITKLPVRLPMFGLYQKFLMGKHDYSDMDVLIANGVNIKTKKPCIIYDQNHMASDFTAKLNGKYERGMWKIYSLPYRMMSRFLKPNRNAVYYSCSEYSAKALSDAIGAPVGVLYPGVEFYDTPTKKKEQICVMGRISPEKNLKMAVEICSNIPYDCVIAGSVTTPNKPYFEKLKQMATPNISFIENPSRDKFIQIMSESKIILSSSKETFGITTVEGTSLGCIPIVPDNSAHPEVVPLESLRYDTIDDAVNKILRVMKNNNIASVVLEKMQKHIVKFDMQMFTNNLKVIINEVTA